MGTISFNIKGKNTSHIGTAIVCNSYAVGSLKAWDSFGNSDVSINEIGVIDNYKLYECYVDSGSVDYFYFAVKIKQ